MVRKVLVTCLILTLFSTLTAAAGYSSATVTCNATLKVVTSEDALLAVKEINIDGSDSGEGLGIDINNGDLATIGDLAANGDIDTAQNRYIAIKLYKIKNNSSKAVYVKLKCTKTFDDAKVSIYTIKNKLEKWKDWEKLKPGKGIRVLVVVKGSSELPEEVPLELKGKWRKGNAKVWWSFNAKECQMLLEGNKSLGDVEKTDGQTTDEQTKDEEKSKEETAQGGIKDQKDTKGQNDTIEDTGGNKNEGAIEKDQEGAKENKDANL